MITLTMTTMLWAKIRFSILACGVTIYAGTSLPVSDNITLTLRAEPSQVVCVDGVIQKVRNE